MLAQCITSEQKVTVRVTREAAISEYRGSRVLRLPLAWRRSAAGGSLGRRLSKGLLERP